MFRLIHFQVKGELKGCFLNSQHCHWLLMCLYSNRLDTVLKKKHFGSLNRTYIGFRHLNSRQRVIENPPNPMRYLRLPTTLFFPRKFTWVTKIQLLCIPRSAPIMTETNVLAPGSCLGSSGIHKLSFAVPRSLGGTDPVGVHRACLELTRGTEFSSYSYYYFKPGMSN